MNEASWYKLKSGVWGVKIRHDGQVGDEVTVTNKKGESKTMWLTERAAKFDDAQLWEATDEQPGADFEDSMSAQSDLEPF
jgi:glycine cleavage system aminomethyltransferase T